MKRILLTLSVVLAALIAAAQGTNFRLTAQIPDVDKVVIGYTEFTPEKNEVEEVIDASSGWVEYECELHYAARGYIKQWGEPLESAIFFLFYPGEEVHVEGSLATARDRYSYKMSGTTFYQNLAKILEERNVFQLELCDIEENLKANKITQAEARAARIECNQRSDKWMLAYIKAHPNEPESYSLITFVAPWAEEAYDALSDEVKSGPLSTLFQKEYGNAQLFSRQQKAAEAKAELALEVGKQMPAFRLKQPDGKEFNSKALRKKVAVIDFWGSWCTWCIKGIPQMREFYEKHSDKVEFVSIACSDTDKLWRRALEKHPMPWPQVFSPDGTVEKQFGVEVYPTKIVVGQDGVVLKVFQGESAEFYSYLESVLSSL